jgi:hypothetical protein
MRCHARHFGIVLSALVISCNSWAQTSGTLAVQVNVPGGSPSGLVVVASLSFPDTAAGFSGTRVFAAVSDSAGRVSFSLLPFGIYSICAEPRNGILIEPCEWAVPDTVHLTAKNLSGNLNLTVPKGIPVNIRFDDPEGLIPSGKGLAVQIVTPLRPLNLYPSASDSAGVNYQLMAPPNVAASIQLLAGSLRIVDGTGSPVKFASPASSFNLSSTVTNQFFRYTVHRGQ